MFGLSEFELALFEILLTAGNDQLQFKATYSLYLACAKQAAAVITVSDVCSVLTV